MALRPLEVNKVQRFTALVIGKAGIGKTSLLRTIPETEGVCVINAESGLLCVADLVESGRVQGYEVETVEELREVYKALTTDEFKEKYKWVFIDSLTEISSRVVGQMKAKYTDRKDSFVMWGEYTDVMTNMIKVFRDIEHYNVVFTCLDDIDKDDNNKRYVAPSISGSGLKNRLTSYFDEVFYYTMVTGEGGKEVRGFITQPTAQYPAKDRSGKLGHSEEPNLGKIKEKIVRIKKGAKK